LAELSGDFVSDGLRSRALRIPSCLRQKLSKFIKQIIHSVFRPFIRFLASVYQGSKKALKVPSEMRQPCVLLSGLDASSAFGYIIFHKKGISTMMQIKNVDCLQGFRRLFRAKSLFYQHVECSKERR